MKRILPLLLPLMLLAACSGEHFITDPAVRKGVRADFVRRQQSYGGALKPFLTLPENLSVSEREAMEFLYAYMPLADVADRPQSYFLEQVRASFRAREEMDWDVPEELFRHFVLPVRVNNENLDSARTLFYRELEPRVKGLSMYDAILEINHWCLSKATYAPSDARTRGPLATLKEAAGRCGEESVFMVAALRAVGIPARQVYTPRWAHTESNHAWVEAWADGRWWFTGACEPNPVLDRGWFALPASRALFLHTRVFGRYDGPEEVVVRTPGYTEINLTDRYARTASARVRVVGRDGIPVKGARVEFCIYNASEFFPAITKFTDAAGETTLTAGIGDLLVWASKDGAYGYRKLSVGQEGEVVVKLTSPVGAPLKTERMTICPPVETYVEPELPQEVHDRCNARIAQDDSIRTAYTSTFPSRASASAFTERYDLPDFFTGVLEHAAGNAATVVGFLLQAADPGRALDVLLGLSRKDIADVDPEVLWDSYNAPGPVLGPRVEDEFLTPYKGFFLEHVPASLQEAFRGGGNPARAAEAICSWVGDHITVDKDPLFWNIPMSPKGVWELRVANPRSRDLLMVSLGNTFGVRMRRNPLSGQMRYLESGVWKTLPAAGKEGRLVLTYRPEGHVDNPEYGRHYALCRIVDGRLSPIALQTRHDPPGERISATGGLLPEGDYLLTSGNRLHNDSTPVTISLFHVSSGKTVSVPIRIDAPEDALSVLGKFDILTPYRPVLSGIAGKETTILEGIGNGFYVTALLDVGSEPANHVLNDLSGAREALEAFGRPILLVTPDEARMKRLQREVAEGRFGRLPANTVYGIDSQGAIQSRITEGLLLRKNELPIVFLSDNYNHILFVSQGYAIGLGDRLAEAIARM